ncbi:hypothetical protein SERLA73DRAFT_190930 [Serpula lacrymans var. lacrymans S7.3]|uniref:Major facilitator superfamily (MFS) profile domain-containing protein n=2 Tax=Serpula lacrymans var. lacrymans TaxID=341189 RepID=F8QGM9_SERL3|nr:uncharacterized protein SERLADRAFT_456919 [Serpula lacrymans var. lacrymans S7.9]EGN92575.1 hypothetical protein SERLA73DRAFT_190930 [Serpula lacrymans var. lacrymans S7.3]EGO29322.1 hypothetical protein SERLADRAFT_456919 [Serpula lacrymans var. lacrymans S7.9]
MAITTKAKDVAIIIAVSGVTTLNVFLTGSLTVALPTIGKDLNFKQADLQWPINVYALSYGCLLLLFGRVGDIIGGRTMFLVGSIWFTIWSIATAFAPNDTAFIIFMALKGMGAAANTPAAIGLCSSCFPEGPSRNKAYSALGAGQAIGFIMGLVLGGVLTETRATWRSLFYIQAGLGALFVLLGFLVLPKDRAIRRYSKGLDWGGALLSTTGLGLLTYSLADSAIAPKGWSSPQIPSLLTVSVLILGAFLYYERWRESKNLSVLIPLSMWRQPGAKMGSLVALVFFAWWSFNTLSYFMTLYYQQVVLLVPLQTSLRFIPMAISGLFANVLSGYFMTKVPGQLLMLIGLVGGGISPILFALIDVKLTYWAMGFPIAVLIVWNDVAYPLGNLQIASAFDEDSQSLAGGVFNVATRIATSIGLAITSSIATSVSERYNAQHPTLAPDSPEVLMVGFRAAGWTCFAASAISVLIAIFGMRGIGKVGQMKSHSSLQEGPHDISMGDIKLDSDGNSGSRGPGVEIKQSEEIIVIA